MIVFYFIDTFLNVGLGNSTPASELHIFENSGNAGAAAGLTMEQDGAGDAVMHFVLTGVQDRFKFRLFFAAGSIGTKDKTR